VIRRAYRTVRGRLRHAGPLRSGWYAGLAVRDLLADRWRRAASFELEFARSTDPWGYASDAENTRHRVALELVDGAACGRRWVRALEVGCAEGLFTEVLAARCDSLLATDFAPLALQRAGKRCAALLHVQVQRWDVRSSNTPGRFDLIVAMDVLSTIHRPHALAGIRGELVDALEPGGVLLLGDVRMNDVFENAWWSRHFLRGGKWIISFFGEHPLLKEEQVVWLPGHVIACFRRKPDARG
jgi:2-polyprenyl-3-methyl-5-hydroxy-6-metoxy-1,4-benzoquinol methylase